MEKIRLTGIPSGERKIRKDYYLAEPEEILRAACVVDGINEDGFTKLLYYPQCSERTIIDEIGTRVVRTTLATTLMVETKDKSTGRRKWETIGHVYGVSDSKLEELGFKEWEKSDYSVPDPRIEIQLLNKETLEVVKAWIAAQNTTP